MGAPRWHRGAIFCVGLLSWGCSFGEKIVISEFMASNGATLADEEEDYGDWIEVHNTGPTAVSLDGWFLTDNPKIPRRWQFPPILLPADEYLVVFASGKNQVGVDVELHTNFRLKALSDFLFLVRPNGSVASEYRPYPDQRPDLSYGIASSGEVGFLTEPTPGKPNGPLREK